MIHVVLINRALITLFMQQWGAYIYIFAGFVDFLFLLRLPVWSLFSCSSRDETSLTSMFSMSAALSSRHPAASFILLFEKNPFTHTDLTPSSVPRDIFFVCFFCLCVYVCFAWTAQILFLSAVMFSWAGREASSPPHYAWPPPCLSAPALASCPPLSVTRHNHIHTEEITLHINCHCGRVQGSGWTSLMNA